MHLVGLLALGIQPFLVFEPAVPDSNVGLPLFKQVLHAKPHRLTGVPGGHLKIREAAVWASCLKPTAPARPARQTTGGQQDERPPSILAVRLPASNLASKAKGTTRANNSSTPFGQDCGAHQPHSGAVQGRV